MSYHDQFQRSALDPPKTDGAPQLTRPRLVTKYGEACPIDMPFAVHVSATDPNAVHGIGQRIAFDRPPTPPPTAEEIEAFAREVIRKRYSDDAREAIYAEVEKEFGLAVAQQIRGRVLVLDLVAEAMKSSTTTVNRRGM
jgi:hypothetical protein